MRSDGRALGSAIGKRMTYIRHELLHGRADLRQGQQLDGGDLEACANDERESLQQRGGGIARPPQVPVFGHRSSRHQADISGSRSPCSA